MNKKYKYGFCVFLCISIYITISRIAIGAATGYLKKSIANEQGLTKELHWNGPDKRISANERKYKSPAFYVGNIKRDGSVYFGIAIDNVRVEYKKRRQVLLLIPSDNVRRPILEEYDMNTRNAIGEVEVIMEDVPLGPMFPDYYKYFGGRYPWAGYPVKVSLGANTTDPSKPNMWVFYRFGVGEKELESKPIIDNLLWQRRNRYFYYCLNAVYPLAFAIDVVTLPIQFLLWLFVFHV